MTETGKVHEPLTDLFCGFTLDIEDPFPIYARLRAENPVAWNADQGFWVASRHAECMAVSTSTDTFCSVKGILTFEIGADYTTPPTMMHTDPPDHTRYRSLVQPAFGRKVVRTLEDSVHAAAKALVDALPLDEPVEIVAPLAVPLPVQVIAQLLGLPESEWDKVWDWSEASIPGTEIFNDEERRNRLNAEMMAELMRLVATSRTEPRDDVISMLSSVEIDGDRLTDDELAMFLNQILVAGNETTRNTISGGLVALAENPDQWARLVADRSLIPSAVEEILRWTTAVIYFMRTATVDTMLGGRQIEAGAHDAWLTPIVMKKGRPAHTVRALVDPAQVASVREVLVRETGTMGVRGTQLERWPQSRTFDTVEVEGRTVRVKVTAGRVKAEHDDAAQAARALGLPLREVTRRAEQAWRDAH